MGWVVVRWRRDGQGGKAFVLSAGGRKDEPLRTREVAESQCRELAAKYGETFHFRVEPVGSPDVGALRDAAGALVAALDAFEPTLASMTLRCYGENGYNGPYFATELTNVRALLSTIEGPRRG